MPTCATLNTPPQPAGQFCNAPEASANVGRATVGGRWAQSHSCRIGHHYQVGVSTGRTGGDYRGSASDSGRARWATAWQYAGNLEAVGQAACIALELGKAPHIALHT